MIRDRRLCAKRVKQQNPQGLSHPDTMLRLAHHSYTTPRRALCADCSRSLRELRTCAGDGSSPPFVVAVVSSPCPCLPPSSPSPSTDALRASPATMSPNGTSLLPPCGIHSLPSAPFLASRRQNWTPLPTGVLLALHQRCQSIAGAPSALSPLGKWERQ